MCKLVTNKMWKLVMKDVLLTLTRHSCLKRKFRVLPTQAPDYVTSPHNWLPIRLIVVDNEQPR